jgi:hypothetical protein
MLLEFGEDDTSVTKFYDNISFEQFLSRVRSTYLLLSYVSMKINFKFLVRSADQQIFFGKKKKKKKTL